MDCTFIGMATFVKAAQAYAITTIHSIARTAVGKTRNVMWVILAM